MRQKILTRSLLGLAVACMGWGFVSCGTDQASRLAASHLLTSQGFAEWQQREQALKERAQAAEERYRRESSLDNLQVYEEATRTYLDNGFALYRAYKTDGREYPPDLVASLHARASRLVDVADEYLRHKSIRTGTMIADELVLNYSDLEGMDHAQRRAEAILQEYRYRTNY